MEKEQDIVERLRGNYVTGLDGQRDFSPYVLPISIEAADEIERLRKLLVKAEKYKPGDRVCIARMIPPEDIPVGTIGEIIGWDDDTDSYLVKWESESGNGLYDSCDIMRAPENNQAKRIERLILACIKWADNLDLLVSADGCEVSDMIGGQDGELGRIYTLTKQVEVDRE